MTAAQSSTQRVAPHCPICGDLAHDRGTSGIGRMYGALALQRAVLWESSELAVFPAPGTLAVGYAIVAPATHVPTFSHLSPDLLRRSETIIGEMAQYVSAAGFGEVVAFEHGSAEHEQGASCVPHAHLHVTPVPDPAALRRYLATWYRERMHPSLADVSGLADSGAYVLLLIGSETYSYRTPFVASQLIRQCISGQLGKPDHWDWRTNPFPENFWKTIALYRGLRASTPA